MKRYHWIKLDTAFFERKEIKKLRSINDKYVVIYIKLLLAAANSEGYLKFEEIEEDIFGELALAVDEVREDIKVVCLFLERLNLFSIIDGDAFLPEAIKNVGSESSSAERVRNYRERKQALQCNKDVTASALPNNDDVTSGALHGNVEREESREDKSRERGDSKQDENVLENNCDNNKTKSNTLPPSLASFDSKEEAEKKAFALEFVRVFNNFTSSNAKNISEVMGYTSSSSRATENLKAIRKVFAERKYLWSQCLEVAKKESGNKDGKIIKGKERFWHFRELLFYYLQNGNGKSDEIGRHYAKDELEKIAKVEVENKIAQQESLRLEEKEIAIARRLGITKQELENKASKLQIENGMRGVKIEYKTLLEKIESGEIKL